MELVEENVSLFGKRLLAAMQAAGYSSPEALARDLKTAKKTSLRRYINEGCQPKADTLAEIAAKLNVDAEYLLGKQDEPRRSSAPVSELASNTNTSTSERRASTLLYVDGGRRLEVPDTPDWRAFFQANVIPVVLLRGSAPAPAAVAVTQ